MPDAPGPGVTVFVAQGCHLCEAALEVIERVRAEVTFTLEVVDVTGDPELEARYRSDLPVVEVDGRRAFRYFVTADGLRAALG
jgi:hypothetical protein